MIEEVPRFKWSAVSSLKRVKFLVAQWLHLAATFRHFPILETDSTWPLPCGRVFVLLRVIVHHEDVQVRRHEHAHRDLDTETRALKLNAKLAI